MEQVEIEEFETPNEIKKVSKIMEKVLLNENINKINILLNSQYPDGSFIFANSETNKTLLPEIINMIREKDLDNTIIFLSEFSNLNDILWGLENFEKEHYLNKLEYMTILLPKKETGIKIRCRSCGGIEGESITKQTAASDEAAANIVICVSCGKQQY